MSVWSFADKIKNGSELSGQCHRCKKIIKCSKRSTTSLKEHLKIHGIDITKTLTEPKYEEEFKENPEMSLKRISKRLQVKKTEKQTSSNEYENCFICNVYLGPYRNALNSYIEDSDKKICEQIETIISTRVSRRASKHSSICLDCFSKLTKYNNLQNELNEIQQNLYNLYHNSHGNYNSGLGEFVSVKVEDTSEDFNQPTVKLNCQKCHCTFNNLYEMAQHKNCRNLKIDNSKISNEFIQQAEDAGINYDFNKFQNAFFSKHEIESLHKVRPKKPTIPQTTKKLDEKISPDFKRMAKDKGIDYDIETFHKTFGGEQSQNEDSEKKKVRKINIKTNHGVSKDFLKQLQTDGIDYNLELFQKVFGYTDNLDYHRKLYKLDYAEGENGENSVKCKHCKETFTNRSKFVQHMRTHKTREFFCDECEKEFRTKVCLVIHNATDHERRKVGPFECPICFKTYADRTALRTHYHIHIGDRSYLCGVCGADFFHKKSFEMHSMMHEDIRPFECDICKKTFRTKGKLTIHLRVHTGEKKYECPYCPGKRFAQKYGMDLHIKKTHMNLTQNYTEQCRICGMQLQNKSKLKQHLANAHQVADEIDVNNTAVDNEQMDWNYR
ncbi:hypothetical protein PVAND_015365 [Polypedilum vanderplanki]|uniref:C2H2-type domain-containing protein n=1 Tax=Polypedilum vanderplanki TaxID=319348 RepID=A0A9J6BCL0_POLVA|nr:hypothetical protein PVAND_015365 [Polypedilum vanderplanki]